MTADTCDNCRFWRKTPDPFTSAGSSVPLRDVPVGHCRRHAPAPRFDVAPYDRFRPQQWVVTWPETTARDFCGEYQLET